MRIIDISDLIEDSDMPDCPLCDQPIQSGDMTCIAQADRSLGLVHLTCLESWKGKQK